LAVRSACRASSGPGRALRMILSCEALTAAQALQCGLVTDVYPADQLLPAARKLAETILSKGPQAVVMAKKLVREAIDKTIDIGCERERKSFLSRVSDQ